MDEYNFAINKELDNINRDKIIFEHELENNRNRMAFMLQNELGKDIDDVLSGKKLVKISFFNKIKYKLKFIFNKIFEIF
jgi:hypothetical protein